jgi:aromatic-L-amino-acid decarboxylase
MEFSRERIRQLEEVGQALAPDSAQRAEMLSELNQYAEAFMEGLPGGRAFTVTDDQGRGLLDSPIGEQPINLDQALRLLDEHVFRPGVNIGAPGTMAYIPPSSLYPSALGDYLAAVTNRYTGMFFAAPGAVRMEHMLLRWMADFIGYPETSAGDLTSGGSIANLMGVVTARDAFGLAGADYQRAVVYLTDGTHHSVDKALRIAGLGECIRRNIALDEGYRMHPDDLRRAIQEDRRLGLIPWLVVASAGTTDTGAVDPLDEIAQIAGMNQLWLHVDGAYGAMFALCEPGRRVLRGIERSDSLTLDPHKGLFVPVGSGAVLVREAAHLLKAHYYDASYLQDRDLFASREVLSPADLSPELSRPFRGLRLWLPLKLLGVAPFRALLEEKLLLARCFYEDIQRVEGFEVGPEPDLSIVVYRYLPKRGDANEFNRRLVESVVRDGRIFISSTMLNGDFTLRLAVLASQTHLDTVELAVEVLRDAATRIENEG